MIIGRPLVLVVDDDEAMRKLHRRLLHQNDYDVQECASGAVALMLVKRGLRPDLVIADLEMPGMTGDAMVRIMRSIHPGQHVLYVTANIHRVLAHTPDVRRADVFLDKPFTPKALLDAVKSLLTPVQKSGDTAAAPRPPRGDTPSASTAINILAIDTPDTLVEQLRRILPLAEFAVHAAKGEEAASAAAQHRADVLVLDARTARPNGIDACRQIKQSAGLHVPVVMLTAQADRVGRAQALQAGTDEFLTDPVDPIELTARFRALARCNRLVMERDAAERVLIELAMKVEARDPHTGGHCERLARYATAMGGALKLSSAEIDALRLGAYLHDIGNLAVPEAVLLKPEALSSAELEIVRQHPVVGADLCSSLPSLAAVVPIVRHHHERLDGSGYPDGLEGDAIPQLAQIIGLVDTYDALTTRRPHQDAMSNDDAIAILRDQARRGWRERALVQLLEELSTTTFQ